mmetsp:Transcript_39563/g.101607  ORF Transcript_39563/g.101607 Transcript_39563/m.101607 type:complete len:99 (+) Transcript_39563:2056-2352(+)
MSVPELALSPKKSAGVEAIVSSVAAAAADRTLYPIPEERGEGGVAAVTDSPLSSLLGVLAHNRVPQLLLLLSLGLGFAAHKMNALDGLKALIENVTKK